MSLPALRALKDFDKEINLNLVTLEHLKDLFTNIREIDNIITIPVAKGMPAFIKTAEHLRRFRIKQGLLFTNSFSSALLFRIAGINDLTGYRRDLRGVLLKHKIDFPENRDHHRFFYLDLVRFFLADQVDCDYSNEIIIKSSEKNGLMQVLSGFGLDINKRIVGFAPSAAYGTAKEWLPDRFARVIKQLTIKFSDIEIILLGTKAEYQKNEVISNLTGSNSVHNLAGRLDLRQALVAISLCSFFISNDSGLMHVADSLNIPLLGLFGPTEPNKTAPVNSSSQLLHYPVKCAPCLYRECPVDHRCMTAIKVSEVVDHITGRLA